MLKYIFQNPLLIFYFAKYGGRTQWSKARCVRNAALKIHCVGGNKTNQVHRIPIKFLKLFHVPVLI